jgi:hypothetical protein
VFMLKLEASRCVCARHVNDKMRVIAALKAMHTDHRAAFSIVCNNDRKLHSCGRKGHKVMEGL